MEVYLGKVNKESIGVATDEKLFNLNRKDNQVHIQKSKNGEKQPYFQNTGKITKTKTMNAKCNQCQKISFLLPQQPVCLSCSALPPASIISKVPKLYDFISEVGPQRRFGLLYPVKNKVPMMQCSNCNFENHVASSHCNLCQSPFPKGLKHPKNQKRNTMAEKPFECKVCGKNFSKPSGVKRHMRVHTGEKPYICSYCGRGFAHNQDRNRHEMVHTGERPFNCSLCGAGFVRSNSLKKHKETHFKTKKIENGFEEKNEIMFAKIKNFACRFCTKRFDRRQNLLHHERIHTGEKPFHCNVCTKSFRQEFHIRRHMKIHEKNDAFVCQVQNCSEEVGSKKDLQHHFKWKHNDLFQ